MPFTAPVSSCFLQNKHPCPHPASWTLQAGETCPGRTRTDLPITRKIDLDGLGPIGHRSTTSNDELPPAIWIVMNGFLEPLQVLFSYYGSVIRQQSTLELGISPNPFAEKHVEDLLGRQEARVQAVRTPEDELVRDVRHFGQHLLVRE